MNSDLLARSFGIMLMLIIAIMIFGIPNQAYMPWTLWNRATRGKKYDILEGACMAPAAFIVLMGPFVSMAVIYYCQIEMYWWVPVAAFFGCIATAIPFIAASAKVNDWKKRPQ